MESLVFKGVGTALVTPFDQGLIDVKAMKTLVAFNMASGIDFLVPLGTTGETSTLTDEECRQVLDIVLEENNDRLPIVCGMFGKNNTRQILDMLRTTNFEGIHAILVAIADASPVPVILYNVPSRTSVNISAETTLALAEHQNIVATKEASGDFGQIMQILKYKPASFEMLSGDDPLTLPMIACGASGVISVISNAFPQQFEDMVKHALKGEFSKAKKNQRWAPGYS